MDKRRASCNTTTNHIKKNVGGFEIAINDGFLCFVKKGESFGCSESNLHSNCPWKRKQHSYQKIHITQNIHSTVISSKKTNEYKNSKTHLRKDYSPRYHEPCTRRLAPGDYPRSNNRSISLSLDAKAAPRISPLPIHNIETIDKNLRPFSLQFESQRPLLQTKDPFELKLLSSYEQSLIKKTTLLQMIRDIHIPHIFQLQRLKIGWETWKTSKRQRD